MNGLRMALGVAAAIAFGLAGPAHAHDGSHAPGELSGHTAAGLLSATNVDGPKTAKHLRIGIWNSASNITVYHIGQSWNDWVLYLLYDKLLEPSPYLSKGRSWLATEVVPVTPDNRVWEAEIRPGVKWHDGTELTAEDIVFTYEYYRDGPVNRWTHHVSQTPKIDTIELASPTRVRFTSEFPMPNFDLVTAPEMPIFQKKQWEAIEDPRTFTDIPIGTGPYKLVDFKPDEYYHFVAHEDYWLGKPLVDELTLIMIKDPQTMFAALKSGEIDGAARAVPPELVDEWVNDPSIAVVQAPTLWGTWINFNLNQELFNDRELRHALSVAIDPDELVGRVMLGRAQSGKHGWPHLDSTWTKPGMEVPFAQDAAKAGFDALGLVDADGDGFRDLPDGTPFDWRIIVSTNEPLFVRAAELIEDQFASVGIRTHVRAVDAATFADMRSGGDYEFYISDITPHGVADQDQYMQFYNAPEMRRLLDDEPERLALYEKWWAAETRDTRLQASFELQEYENKYPSRFMLWYPDGLFAYRPGSYDNYASSFGYGIYHKYSFLPDAGRAGTTESIDHQLDLD
jgi:peptide/nickel transport system substrate-binding protein